LGSSYIKGELIEFLVKKKALNIHAGVVPYYRGNDCNFWALYDNNPHLVGSTIHLLTKGLDSGNILYHAMSNVKLDPFEYTMSTLKSAFCSICDKIKNNSLFNLKSYEQEKTKQLRYTKRIDFNEAVVKEYFNKKIDLDDKKFDNSLLIDPYYMEKL
jgi:methionyl-tRNA formyltransferase